VALVLPVISRAAFDFQFNPRAADFTFSREVDPGGGGNTYVVDHLRATFSIPPTPVAADVYTFHVDFPEGAPVEFSPAVDRIDFMAALGRIDTYFGVGSGAGRNAGTLAFDVENLSLTTMAGDTVTFYAAGSFSDAVGVGVDENVDANEYRVSPEEPFRLRSLDVTFRVPAEFIPSGAPDSPATTVVLDIGAGDNLPSASVPTLAPMLRVVPEPGASVVALTGGLALLRRRLRRPAEPR
jgi:hypothetical protein